MDLKAVSVEGMNCFNLCRQGQVAGCSEHYEVCPETIQPFDIKKKSN